MPRLALLQILEERYERKSMIIASQLPISKWYDYIGDPTLADAIMDRLVGLALLQILEERYERKSMIIASQLPISKWYDYIGDPTLADAIMDRLVDNANKIDLKGEYIRERKKK